MLTSKVKYCSFFLAIGIMLSIIGCNKKSAINISDEQLSNYVLCVNGYLELKNRGEDVRDYPSYILEKYGKEFIEEFTSFSRSVGNKVKSCSANITIAECAKSVDLNKQESLYYTTVEVSAITNKTKSLGNLKAETSILCADLKKMK